MKMKKVLALFLAVMMLASVLTACGSGNSGSDTTPQSGAVTGNTGTSTDAAASGTGEGTTGAQSSAANTESVVRDVVTVAVQSDPADFAPWAANSNGRTNALWGIYQELAHIIDGEVFPELMKSYSIADDNMSMDFEIFDYITDSVGNHITADDVIFSFETGTALGYIRGVGMVEKLEKTGDYSLRYVFNTPLTLGALDDLTRWYIVSQKAYEADPNGMSSKPVGTGPYVLTNYVANNSFTYTAREDYWQTDPSLRHARDMANTKTIQYLILPETSQRTIALEMGDADICSEISNEDIEEFREGGSQSANYWTYGVPDNLSALVFANCDSSRVTSDVNLRQAIFYAIDANAILQAVWQGNGTTVHSLSPSWGTGDVSDFDNQDNYYNYSVDKAKEYLAKSNYNNEELIILSESTGNIAYAAQLVQSFLSAAGINAKLQTVDSTILEATYNDPSTWDVLMTQYACNTYAPTSFQVFDPTRWVTGTINHIHDDKLTELLNACFDLSTTGDESLTALHNYVIENAYGMNLVNYTTTMVLPRFMNTVCISYKKTVEPGGCTYTE